MREDNKRMTKECLPDVRLCVTGSSTVGKSAITVRFLTRRFIGEYQQNAEQTYRGLVDVGPDTIQYDLKDTSSTPDQRFLSTWPTCVAVVYSIIDVGSFVYASKLLDDLVTFSRNPSSSTRVSPGLALIGNKKDLEHLRDVSEEDGKCLADKYNAIFWEASASDDYYSILRPLTSLILKSYHKTKDKNSTNSSSPTSSSGNEEKTSTMKDSLLGVEEIQILLRRYSEPCFVVPRIITAPSITTPMYSRRQSDDVFTRTFVPMKNKIRRRKKLRENKSKLFMKGTDSQEVDPEMLRNLNLNGENTKAEVTDTTSNESLSTMRNIRAHHLSRIDRKRVVQRKYHSHKQNNSSLDAGISKSHSFTDLKTLQLLSKDKSGSMTSASSDISLQVESEANLNLIGRPNSSPFINSLVHSNDENHLKKALQSISTSSFSKIDCSRGNRNYWNKLRKDTRKNINLPVEKEIPKIDLDDIAKSPHTMDKKSLRRRFSNIFLPRNNTHESLE